MKRSEMITKIENYFDTVFPNNWDARLFTYSYASEILDLIEEAGMLPPPDHVELISLDNEKGSILYVDYPNPKGMWEEEDDS